MAWRKGLSTGRLRLDGTHSMAKGPSAAAKKKALTEATKLRKDAVMAKAKTCLQKLEASEDDCDMEKSKVDLRVRSEEQAVDKCLKDNFPPA